MSPNCNATVTMPFGQPMAYGIDNYLPAAFELHHWRADTGVISHIAYVEQYPGPFPFLPDPDYPGGPPA